MSVKRYENKSPHSTKILFGNDTDVSYITIVGMHRDLYSVLTTWIIDEESDKSKSEACDWTYDEFKKHFELQYGSPMMYISKADFEWITNEEEIRNKTLYALKIEDNGKSL